MSKGNRKRDPLEKAPGLVSGEPWYTTTSKDYISPSMTQGTEPASKPSPAPAPERGREPGRHRKQKPVRKIRARYIIAAVVTTFLAAPALWMASEIASGSPEPVRPVATIKTVQVPVIVHTHNKTKAICVFLSDSGSSWSAWATSKPC